MGKHSTQGVEPPTGTGWVPTQRPPSDLEDSPTIMLSPVPAAERERSSVSVRIAVLVGILATVMLSTLVWAVNRRTDPNITALPVDPPSFVEYSAAVDVNVSPSGPVPSVSPVASISVTATPSLTPSRGTAASPTPARPGTAAPPVTVPTQGSTPTPAAAAAQLTASFRTTGKWRGGYQAEYTITNRGTATVNGWTVVVVFPQSVSIAVWEARPSTGANGKVTFTNTSSNGSVRPGSSVNFQFRVTGSSTATPTSCTINGAHC